MVAIETAWGSRSPIAWPASEFTPPADGGAWLAVDMLWGDASPLTMGLTGTGKSQVAGLLQLTLYAPRGAGRGAIPWDVARDIFNRALVSGVQFGPASGPMAGDGAGAWESVIVRFPFIIEDTL